MPTTTRSSKKKVPLVVVKTEPASLSAIERLRQDSKKIKRNIVRNLKMLRERGFI